MAYYNDLTKLGSVRRNKHRQLIQNLSFTDKYLPDKRNLTDYSSRHPHSIEHLTQEQREEAGVDDGEEVHVMRVLISDLPDIGLPVTHQSGPGEGRQQAEGAGQGQPPVAGGGVGRQSMVGRERWSFSPPREGSGRPGRPLTRSGAARRERVRTEL